MVLTFMFGTWRRHLVVHSAHKAVGVSLAPVEVQSGRATGGGESRALDAPTFRVCLITGPGDDQSALSAKILAEHLESAVSRPLHPVCCRIMDNWAALEDSVECHCAVFFLDRPLPAECLATAAQHVRSGGGLIALRVADGDWLRPGAKGCDLLGAECLGRHPSSRKPFVQVAAAARRHPAVAGVRPFTSGGDLVRTRILNAEAVLVASVPGARDTVAWAYRYGAGRGFCTTLGHPADFRQSSFLRLLTNAIVWTGNDDPPS